MEQAATEEFRKHPDHAVITSFPGLAEVTGARILAEIGDDRDRFADDRALKAYAGSAPVTRASGKVTSITHRRIKNDRLAAVGWVWATYASINPGPPPASTTAGAATTVTATPPLCATCSTKPARSPNWCSCWRSWVLSPNPPAVGVRARSGCGTVPSKTWPNNTAR